MIITDYQERLLGISQVQLGAAGSGAEWWTLERLAEPQPRGCGDVLAVFHRYTDGAKAWAQMVSNSSYSSMSIPSIATTVDRSLLTIQMLTFYGYLYRWSREPRF